MQVSHLSGIFLINRELVAVTQLCLNILITKLNTRHFSPLKSGGDEAETDVSLTSTKHSTIAQESLHYATFLSLLDQGSKEHVYR